MASNLLSELGFDPEAPEVVAALKDAEAFANLITSLVAVRRSLGLRQADIAARLGTSQSVVSDFERIGGDPRLSTVQRYARALNTQLLLDIDGYPCSDGVWTEVREETLSSSWTPAADLDTWTPAPADFALAA